jgi:hypothetical protein
MVSDEGTTMLDNGILMDASPSAVFIVHTESLAFDAGTSRVFRLSTRLVTVTGVSSKVVDSNAPSVSVSFLRKRSIASVEAYTAAVFSMLNSNVAQEQSKSRKGMLELPVSLNIKF